MEPIELEYENMDAVPEPFRGLYTEQNGKVVLTHVNGMKTQADVDKLQGALSKERETRKGLETQLRPWSGMKHEEVLAQLDRIAELEAAAGGKLDDDAINKIVEGRLKQHTSPLQRKIDELTEANTALQGTAESALGTIRDMRMTSAIRTAATAAKVFDTAIPDIEIIAKSAFELTDDGQMITKADAQGVTPGIGLDAYFREMQQKRPHWFPQSNGGGAGGGQHRGPGGKNPFSSEHWNMTEQGALVRENPSLAAELAKAAGTTVGGPRPAKKS